jgi:hypothetical protein
MPYSESLANRIRQTLAATTGLPSSGRLAIAEKKMFGGIGFLLGGNLLVGAWHTSLIARVGPEQYDLALAQEHVRQFDITGRAMRGWILVEADGIADDRQLREWIDRARTFVATLPAK